MKSRSRILPSIQPWLATSPRPLQPGAIWYPRRRFLILVGLLLILAAIVYLSPLRQLLHPSSLAAIQAWIISRGAWAPLVFMLMTAAVVSAGAPRLLMAVLGGAVFGWLAGGMFTLVGTLAGCWITFTYARWLGYDWIQARLSLRLTKLSETFRHHGLLMTIALRCAPVGNCHVMNLLLSVTPISPWAFLAGTACGILPTTIIYALFGSAASGSVLIRVTTASLMLIALGLIYAVIASRSKRVRGLVAELTNHD